jgi:PBP1b-binding outer membrane lipoprotein LpoB
MNRNIFSILIIAVLTFNGCNQSVKQDTAVKNTGDTTAGTVSVTKRTDTLVHNQATVGTKKLPCCIGPPSRVKIRVAKKKNT